jgi:hypothetical protein
MQKKHHLIFTKGDRFTTLSGCTVWNANRYCVARRDKLVESFTTDKECQAAFLKACVAANQYPEELYYNPMYYAASNA